MPIEIRELIIKVTIAEGNKSRLSADSQEILELKKQIIKECTERVISKLEKKAER